MKVDRRSLFRRSGLMMVFAAPPKSSSRREVTTSAATGEISLRRTDALARHFVQF